MKALTLRFIIAILTFTLGAGLTTWCKAYNARVRAEQELKRTDADYIAPAPIDIQQSLYFVPKGLAVELENIDRVYKKRCGTADVDYDGWPGIMSLEKLLVCYDNWAKARHAAILAEIGQHLIEN